MLRTQFTLIAKRQLTHDVYELTYACPELSKEPPKPGQYVMFQLAPGLNRAYSLASSSLGTIDQFPQDSNIRTLQLSNSPTFQLSNPPTFTLIIKRIPDGRGSPMICDALVGTIFSGIIPLWHFTLRDTPRSKCFIGTGTGFAPLYHQILSSRALGEIPQKCTFIFGVRNFADAFYAREILELWSHFEEFEYRQYFSRESVVPTFEHPTNPLSNQSTSCLNGYVTDWITPMSVIEHEEFYICGSPAMVKSARERLETFGIEKENIFWEQF